MVGIDPPMSSTSPSISVRLAPPVLPDPGPLATRDSARLCLTLTWADRRCVLALAGALDADSVIALETEFDQLVRAGFDEVVLDTGGLAAVDESGAVTLAELWARLRNNGVFCRVRGLHPMFADNPLELLLFVRSAGPDALAELMEPSRR